MRCRPSGLCVMTSRPPPAAKVPRVDRRPADVSSQRIQDFSSSDCGESSDGSEAFGQEDQEPRAAEAPSPRLTTTFSSTQMLLATSRGAHRSLEFQFESTQPEKSSQGSSSPLKDLESQEEEEEVANVAAPTQFIGEVTSPWKNGSKAVQRQDSFSSDGEAAGNKGSAWVKRLQRDDGEGGSSSPAAIGSVDSSQLDPGQDEELRAREACLSSGKKKRGGRRAKKGGMVENLEQALRQRDSDLALGEHMREDRSSLDLGVVSVADDGFGRVVFACRSLKEGDSGKKYDVLLHPEVQVELAKELAPGCEIRVRQPFCLLRPEEKFGEDFDEVVLGVKKVEVMDKPVQLYGLSQMSQEENKKEKDEDDFRDVMTFDCDYLAKSDIEDAL